MRFALNVKWLTSACSFHQLAILAFKTPPSPKSACQNSFPYQPRMFPANPQNACVAYGLHLYGWAFELSLSLQSWPPHGERDGTKPDIRLSEQLSQLPHFTCLPSPQLPFPSIPSPKRLVPLLHPAGFENKRIWTEGMLSEMGMGSQSLQKSGFPSLLIP